MNLTELQIELRNIEEHISKLHQEVENMKPQTEEEKKTNFNEITQIAIKYPINGLNIANASEIIKKKFISALAYLAVMEEKGLYARILYLTRVAAGCGLKMSAEDIYKSGLEFEVTNIEKVSDELKDYKHNYLVESFILTNLEKDTPKSMFSTIAYIAQILNCDKEELQVIAQVAKSKLTNNFDLLKEIPIPTKNRWSGTFRDYIPKTWIVKQRITTGYICLEKNEDISNPYAAIAFLSHSYNTNNTTTTNPYIVKSRLDNGTVVRKHDILLTYEIETSSNKKGELRIVSTNNGIVFFKETNEYKDSKVHADKFLKVYVISYFDDCTDFETEIQKKTHK